MAMTTLQWPDYLILVLFLVISVGIGVYHSLTGGRQKTTQEFVMANRHLSIIPTTISLFVSYQSAISALGSTAEMYLYGVMYMIWFPVGFTLAAFLVERLVIPWIYALKLMSINDYLERRFESKLVRAFGALTSVVAGVMYMGVCMYAPSAALENATGLPTSVSIPLMAVVSIAYTALGGMRAVIWTDVFQFGTMVGGTLAILIKGMVVVGGFGKVLEICGREGRLIAVDWNPDPTTRHTVWGFIFGSVFMWLAVYGLSQASVQRYSATATLKKARITVLLNIPAFWISYFCYCATGLTVFAYYAMVRCDPLVNKDVSNPNQLLSLFVMTIFSDAKGFAGLFLATLYGGALSSISSSLSGVAANLWDDILKIWLDEMTEQRKALTNRLLVVLMGVLATGFAFAAAFIPGPITQIALSFGSAVFGPMLGVFLLGGMSKHCNWKGALVGAFFGLAMNLWLTIGAYSLTTKHPPLPAASVEGCLANNVTWYNETAAMLDYDSYNFTMLDRYLLNATSTVLVPALNSTNLVTSQLTGTARFYSISYLWYTTFGMLNTAVVGLIVSLIFRDKKAERRVQDCLLISFRHCLTWNEETKNPPESHLGEYIAVKTTSSSVIIINNNNNNKDSGFPFEEVVPVSIEPVEVEKENEASDNAEHQRS